MSRWITSRDDDAVEARHDKIMLAACVVGLAIVALVWVSWAWDLVVLHDYAPDPFGLFEEDSQVVAFLLGL